MKLQRIAQILERFVFGMPLTRNVNFNALRHDPFILLPDAGSKFLFHSNRIPCERRLEV